jgi:thiol-disulfide isomerase/thioredoxin
MKKILLSSLLPMFILLLLSFDKQSMLNRPMLLLPNKTLDGKVIDQNYYKGHVTLVSFMYIGCLPCMVEISTLNKLKKDYRGNNQVQILCAARQMRQQMIDFNAHNNTLHSKERRTFGADSITYTILPACKDAKSKIVMNGSGGYTINSECNTIEEKFGVEGFPTLFYVDKKGIVRKIDLGAPDVKNDPEFYAGIKKELDILLSE